MSLETLVNQHYDKLNENDMLVLNYVMQNKKVCSRLTITELSKHCSVSTASIVRIAQKLGFSGYSEFKYSLKSDASDQSRMSSPINPIQMLTDDLEATLKFITKTDLTPILDLLYNATRVFGFGTGYCQQNALQAFSHSMAYCDKRVFLIPAKHELDNHIPFMKTGDVVIIASYSGDIKEYNQSIHSLKLLGIPIISITNFNKNALAAFTHHNLYYQATSLTPDLRPRRVSYATLNIVQDILYREYLQYWLERK